MGKRFVVEEVRALSWSLRLRDTETGELIDVPVNPGSRFSPPGMRDKGGPDQKQEAGGPGQGPVADPPASPSGAPRKAAKKASRKKEPRPSSTPADDANPLETREGRRMPLDDKSRTEVEEHRTFSASALKGTKKGGLGWEETTDAGRSGLRARFKAGYFKILHAGGDVYGLFYEWDSGKYERIACGKAEDMMEIATKRALESLPPQPRTMLDLEMARLLCSSDAPQRERVAEHPAPGTRAEKRRAAEGDTAPPRARGRRSAAPADPSTSTPAPPTSPPSEADVAVNPQLDAELMSSLSQALAELED